MQGGGRFEEALRTGQLFSAANQAAATYTLFGSTTATGLALSNPAGSGKLLSVVSIGFMKVAAAGAAIENLVISVGAMGGSYAHTTPLTVQKNRVGGNEVAVGLVDASFTLTAAGTIIAPFWSPSVSATATTGIPDEALVMIDGLYGILPGFFLQLAGGFTTTPSGLGSISWREYDF